MHAPTTRRLLLLSTTLTLLAAGGSCLAQVSEMMSSVYAHHVVNNQVVTNSVRLGGVGVSSGTTSHSHGPGAGFTDGGVSAFASPGRVRVSAGSYGSYSGLVPQPSLNSFYDAVATARFSDPLTITGRQGTSLPLYVRIRVNWAATGSYFYDDPASGPGWGGVGSYWARNVHNAVLGSKSRNQQSGQLSVNGAPSVNMIFTEVTTTTATGYVLSASVDAEARSAASPDRGAVAGYARAVGHCSMEVLGIEIRDPNTGALLAATVTGASGHVYPVVQPPEPWMPATTTPYLTAHAINPETGSVMLSFASQGGVTYRVKASRDMGRTDPWQVISTHTGQPGATLATFIDPDAMTQSSRFFIIERD